MLACLTDNTSTVAQKVCDFPAFHHHYILTWLTHLGLILLIICYDLRVSTPQNAEVNDERV